MSQLKRIGIFGPSESGKSTLAHKLSEQFWLKEQRRSIVFDPQLEVWGDHAFVTNDETIFWDAVWKGRDCVVIVEDTSATINRDRDLIPVFTKIRHHRHHLMVIGHSGQDLLPVMRQQLTVVYLFRQPKSAAKTWAENFCDDGLLITTELQQYEFVYFYSYGKPRRMKLKL